MLTFGINLDKDKYRNDIYPETHYYCNNNYEAYVYSAGAIVFIIVLANIMIF